MQEGIKFAVLPCVSLYYPQTWQNW